MKLLKKLAAISLVAAMILPSSAIANAEENTDSPVGYTLYGDVEFSMADLPYLVPNSDTGIHYILNLDDIYTGEVTVDIDFELSNLYGKGSVFRLGCSEIGYPPETAIYLMDNGGDACLGADPDNVDIPTVSSADFDLLAGNNYVSLTVNTDTGDISATLNGVTVANQNLPNITGIDICQIEFFTKREPHRTITVNSVRVSGTGGGTHPQTDVDPPDTDHETTQVTTNTEPSTQPTTATQATTKAHDTHPATNAEPTTQPTTATAASTQATTNAPTTQATTKAEPTTQATTNAPTTQTTTKAEPTTQPTTATQATTKAPDVQTSTQNVTEGSAEGTTQKAPDTPAQATTKAPDTQATTQAVTEKATETTTNAVVTETGTETTTKRPATGGRGPSGGGGGGSSSSSAKADTDKPAEKSTENTEPNTEAVTEKTEASKAETGNADKESTPNTIPEVKVAIGKDVISIDGKDYKIDASAYIQSESNSTLVPLRFVAAVLSGDDIENADNSKAISWNASAKQATVTKDNMKAVFTAGSNIVEVNGVKTAMENGVKAEIKDGRMYVPFRAIGNFLGVQVDWDAETKTAIYKTK